jgi:hypothetical protein
MPSGENTKGYGFVSCSTIATNGRNMALKNADNYAIFALAITLNQINWVGGNPGTKP